MLDRIFHSIVLTLYSGGLLSRMIVCDREYVTKKYKLHKLKALEDLVANAVEVRLIFPSSFPLR